MTPNLLDELEKIVALSEKATPGKVELHTSCSWRRIVAERGRPFLVPTIDPDRHQNMDTVESAEFVVALVNWFRTHAPALADMAKRMEAAEREVADLRRDAEENDELRQKMGRLLTAVANALKGKPEPLQLHSWHDLPELAEAAVRDAARWNVVRNNTGDGLRLIRWNSKAPEELQVMFPSPALCNSDADAAIDATQEGAG